MSTNSITNVATENLGGQCRIELDNAVLSIGGVEPALDARGDD